MFSFKVAKLKFTVIQLNCFFIIKASLFKNKQCDYKFKIFFSFKKFKTMINREFSIAHQILCLKDINFHEKLIKVCKKLVSFKI